MNEIPGSPDHLAFELGNTIIQVRDGLEFQHREVGEGKCYVVEDTSTGVFYRIGFPEYSFLSLLNGERTVDEAIAICATALRAGTISVQRAESMCSWLIENELATTQYSTSSQRMSERRKVTGKQKWVQRMNPIMVRFSLGCPDRPLGWLFQWTRWLFNTPLFIAWLVLCVSAILLVAQEWDRFSQGAGQVLAQDNWIWLGATWIGVKLIHELGHGLIAKKYGGEVRDCGLLLLLLIPMPFVDVTSSWRFPLARQRILTAAAGMMLETFLASIAVFVWCYTSSGFVSQTAYNIILTASVTTLLFNANPLMRFDGYYILVDALNIPNLGTKGQQWLHAVANWLFFGVPRVPSRGDWRHRITMMYGIAAFVWRMLIVVTLTAAAYTMFDGIGLVIAIGSLLITIALPVYKTIKFFCVGRDGIQPRRLQPIAICACIGCLVWAVLFHVPGPSSLNADAVIDYDPLSVVRAKTAGFVTKLHVQPGDFVQAGQLLATLSDQETRIDRDNTLIEKRISELRARGFQIANEHALYQAELEQLGAIKVRLKELEKSVVNLEVRSPTDGIVITPTLDEKVGLFLNRGDEVMSVGDTKKKKIVGLVSPYRSEQLKRFEGQRVHANVFGRWETPIEGTLRTVGVRASKSPVHEALTAIAGGTLTVQQIQSESAEDSSDTTWELAEPHVKIEVLIDSDSCRELYAGQPVQICMATSRECIYTHLERRINQWLADQIQTNHGI